ncbi:MAG: HDIG domain-containing protein [Lentisphaerales bacterium]|jgi:putative nucleotidyltransferase with HDIG domain|nr:MAG: HDIG domain-containing protein [Lentisphaerales bacterium]
MKLGVSRTRARKAKSRDRNAKGSRRRLYARRSLAISALSALIWAVPMVFLTALSHFRWKTMAATAIAGNGFILAVGLLACGFLARLLCPDLPGNIRKIVLALLVSLLSLVPIVALLNVSDHLSSAYGWFETIQFYLLPLSLAPLLATILLGPAEGIVLGMWVGFSASILGGHDYQILGTTVLVTICASRFGQDLRKRSTVFKAGLVIALSEILVAVAANLIDLPATEPMPMLMQASACLVNGMVTAVAVLLAVPIFEALFNITTDITLLELSDLGHPLLQRLAIEAPGTYHHSLVVANLAQAATHKIAANSLLARVCSYFHDIGKLTKPDFFAENIQRSPNPHDGLLPSMSTLVITAHVKEGVSLALLHKLPRPIIESIQQHHGTGIVRYFHHKAVQQLELELANGQTDAGGVINESDYRYPGPKPSFRESAIISLADSVEAASRSMEKPNPGHLESMVNEVVNARLLDGQLDSCDLTMKDLARIKRSFVFTLTSMLHGRMAYPKDEDLDKQQSNGVPAQPVRDQEARSESDGASYGMQSG